jgi:uncharacterized membrane protein YjgN (DUF898 family)
MAQVRISCPNCGFGREVEESAIPPGAATAGCPKCGRRFPLQQGITGMELSPPALTPPPDPPAASAPVQPPPPPPRPRTLSFAFTGNARDYFGIWIINTLLKIITLGIYSAWAKVRKRRYFYGNTLLNNTVFEYVADPMALFKGWLLAAVCFILYSVGTKVNPVLAGTMGLMFFLAMPWLIVRSRIFNMRNSVHRNIRFTFQPNYKEAYLVFAGLPLLTPFTLGALVPYQVYRQKKFLVENTSYGRNRCIFDASVKDFYAVFFKAGGLLILVIIALFACSLFFSTAFRDLSPLFAGKGGIDKKTLERGALFLSFAIFAGFGAIYLFFAVYVQTALTNLTWQGTRIRNSRFSSTLKSGRMAWLYFSSALAIFFSLGLLIPWVSVRMARYRMETLSLELKDDPQSFLAWGHAEVDAAGEEIGDLFGIDIGI